MSVFHDSKQFYECVGELMDRAKVDPQVGGKIGKSGIIIQFRYTDPDATTTVNGKDKPTQAGAYVDVIHGPCSLKPDVVMTMKADTAQSITRHGEGESAWKVSRSARGTRRQARTVQANWH